MSMLCQDSECDNLKESYTNQSLLEADTNWPDDVRRALACLNRHLFDFGFTAHEMRKMCRLTHNNFSTKFRYFTGKTPSQYIRYHRIACSREIMESVSFPYSITYVAYEVGYEHPSTFCTAFKKVEGVTPQKMKEKLKKDSSAY